ncbi:hypothetical protein DFR33_10364 [Bradymonas sediminis]|nr:hypothetical protein DFR33_10364 [Bradymonas sediminis]
MTHMPAKYFAFDLSRLKQGAQYHLESLGNPGFIHEVSGSQNYGA